MDFLVTRIDYFGLRVYDAIRSKSRGTKRSPPPPSFPLSARVQRLARLGREEVGREEVAEDDNVGRETRCTRLQDEINTILCKRARLIARGKASGISGIPNKLTLNAEGSPLFHPSTYIPGSESASGIEPPTFPPGWVGTTRRNICIDALRNTPYPNIT